MKSRVLTGILWVIAALSFAYYHYNSHLAQRAYKSSQIPLIREYLSLDSTFLVEPAPPVFKVTRPGFPSRLVFFSRDVDDTTSGYGGPINLLITLDQQTSKINALRVHEHHETPSYTRSLTSSWFLDQFIKYDAMMGGKFKIEALTQATVTTKAVERSIARSVYKVTKEVLKKEATPLSENVWADLINNKSIIIISVILFSIIINYNRHNRKLLLFNQLLTLVLLGWYLSCYFSIQSLLNIYHLKLPSPFQGFDVYLIYFAFFILPLFFPNFYCDRICPFGALSELLFSANRCHRPFPESLHQRGKDFRFFFLIFLLILSCFLNIPIRYEPFYVAFSLKGELISWLILAVVLVFSFLNRRFYCKYFCVLGEVQDLTLRLRKKFRKTTAT